MPKVVLREEVMNGKGEISAFQKQDKLKNKKNDFKSYSIPLRSADQHTSNQLSLQERGTCCKGRKFR